MKQTNGQTDRQTYCAIRNVASCMEGYMKICAKVRVYIYTCMPVYVMLQSAAGATRTVMR